MSKDWWSGWRKLGEALNSHSMDSFSKSMTTFASEVDSVTRQLNDFKIGTVFTSFDEEFIKVGKDAYIETDERLMMNARLGGMGFLAAEDFQGSHDEDPDGEIIVIDKGA